MNIRHHIAPNLLCRYTLPVCLLLTILTLCTALTAIAKEPPATPFITIDTEMHRGAINDAATNLDENLIATASDDKTLKLWERKTGKLLKTMRPPIAEGLEGMLKATAISPDGSTIATGGFTGFTWDITYSVYLFDVRNGSVKSRLTNFPKHITRLAYSQDGSQLIVGLAEGSGISVHSTLDGIQLFEDKNIQGDITAIDTDSKGGIVVTTSKGQIRRYKHDGGVLYTSDSNRPTSITCAKISPDETLLAIGNTNNDGLLIYNYSDGTIAYYLKDPKVSDAKLIVRSESTSVAWYAGGTRLISAGNIKDFPRITLRGTSPSTYQFANLWDIKNRSHEEHLELSTKLFTNKILSFKDGAKLLLVQSEGFVLMKPDFKISYSKNLERSDFMKNLDIFKTNQEAAVTQFSYEPYGKAIANFDINKRKLSEGIAEGTELLSHRYTADGINIENWQDSSAPRYRTGATENNDSRIVTTELELFKTEKSNALAVRHDDKGFILGTSHALRAYNASGRQIWMQLIRSGALSIALSKNDNILVATHDDGTIRRYHAGNGEEIMAFYPHPDRKRWIIWLPSGFFDHGPNSEDLVGFHVNRGKDGEATLVSVNQMYDTFYRPDIIDQAIEGKDISAYLKNLAKPSGTSDTTAQNEKAEKERLAREKIELERTTKQKVEADRLENERKEAERLAAQKREEQRISKEKTDQENLIREKAEAERVATLKAEQERLDKVRLEQEQARLAKIKSEAARKAEEEKLALQKAELERKARLKTEQELLARQKAEEERIAKQKAEAEKLEAERKEAERLAILKREEQRIAKEKIDQENLARQKAEAELKVRLAAQKERAKGAISTSDVTNLVGTLVNSSTLPPAVRFITKSGTASQPDIALVAELCDKGGGIGDVTLFLNDMPVVIENVSRGLKVQQKATTNCYNFEQTISLQNGQNVITLMAYNKGNNIESERNRIELALASSNTERPHLHILTIAVNKYRDGDLQLKYAINDADVLARVTAEKANSMFAGVHVHKLHNEDVTREKLEASFAAIGKQTRRDDVFILFVAGHGITGERDGAYYFLPANFRYTGEESIAGQGVSMNDFKKYLTNIQATKSLLLIDTCNSGSFSEAISSRGVTEKTAITKLARAVGRATIAASSKNQVALEGYEGHGVFSYTVLEGLKGKASNKNGEITVSRLATFIEENLPELTYKKWGYEQIPQKSLQGMDFLIGIK